jgi:uncharacterized protein (TIGR03085 family)
LTKVDYAEIMSSNQNWARIEREHFANTLHLVGPDAPTLCLPWTARDLAAHVVVRERRPDAALGLIIPLLNNHLEAVRQKVAKSDWNELISQVRSGPKSWNPMSWGPVDNLANVFEFFVHHEDVLRAAANPAPRVLPDEYTALLMSRLHDGAWLLWRRAKVGVILTDGSSSVVAKRPPKGAGIVTVTGQVAELVMKSYGRNNSQVIVTGAERDLALFAQTNLSV